MVSHAHQCIFVHIPKCAGTSIEDVIWPRAHRTEGDLWMGFVGPMHNRHQTGGLQHLLAAQVRREVGDAVFADYFKFAFVRNPWDRVISQYIYMRRRPDLRDWVGLREDASLGEYLERIATRKHVQWEPQVSFLHDEAGDLMVDFVGRVETYEADARSILGRLGLADADLPHAKQSERSDYRDYYDPATRERVAEMYRADIEAFGYEY